MKESGKETTWYYMKRDRKFIKSKFEIIDYKLYEFDEYGRLVKNSGWKEYEDGKWRYFHSEDYGAFVSSFEKIDGHIYSFDGDEFALLYE